MQASKTPPATSANDRQNAELAGALADARRFGFDLPSVASIRQAEVVLARLSSDLPDVGPLDVAVGEDGTLEITTFHGVHRITIDIGPSGPGIHIIAQDAESGAITFSASVDNAKDVASCVERAA